MTKIFAHRGSAGTHPENTMVAFHESERVDADGIELDVHLTKDDEIVVIHDQTVDRTTNGSGKVRDLTLREIKELDAGSGFSNEFKGAKIPALKEVLTWMQGNQMELNIELKNVAIDYPNFEEKLVHVVQQSGMTDRVIISCFNHYVLKKLHELNPEIECALLYSTKLYNPWDYAKTLGARGLHPHYPTFDENMIEEARRNGFPVRVYTVNHDVQIERFLKAGCTAIITDFPEHALEIKKKLSVNKI